MAFAFLIETAIDASEKKATSTIITIDAAGAANYH